jgi:hypothetical protein
MRHLIERLEVVTEGAMVSAELEKAVHPVAAKLALRIDHLFDAEFADDFDDGVMANMGVAIDDPKAEKFIDAAYRELWREIARTINGPLGEGLRPILRAR